MPRPAEKRQAVVNLSGLARAHTEKAIKTLVAAMDSDDERVRVDAASRILDRGYGKPAQTVDMTVEHRKPEELSDHELASIAATGRAGTAASQVH